MNRLLLFTVGATLVTQTLCSYIDHDFGLNLIQAHMQLVNTRTQRTVARNPEAMFHSEGSLLLDTSMPLSWFHVPKAGSSLANSLIHTPGVCPGIPVDAVMNRTTSCQNCNDFNYHMSTNFDEAYHILNSPGEINKTTCPGLSKWARERAIGAPGEFEKYYDGRGVMMIRQPEQRLISSYEHIQQQDEWPAEPQMKGTSLAHYAQLNQGCTVRMLTHENEGATRSWCGEMSTLTQDDVELAKNRLEKFAFVGLTEEWNLSICLMRAMFGGVCYGSDFEDTRNSEGSTSVGHDVSVLNGFVDSFDGQLYAKAQEIFAAKLQFYGVNASSCQPCWDHASAHWTEHT